MRGRPKKKCISIEQYTICPSNYQGEHIYQMNRAQLLDNSIRTAQSYSNNCQPYNLLFEMFQENELFFFEYEQGHLLNRIGTSLIDILELLTPREEKVIKLSFGIEDSIVRTAAEVAAEFNVTTNRIQEIKEKALRKLRHPSRKGKLAQIFFSAQELPSVPDGYPQKEIYESFIRELCRRMEERVRAFSQVGDSVEEIYLLALSKVYPKELIIRYFDGIRNKYPQLFRKIDKEALYSGSLGCLNLPNQLRTVLYWLLRDRAYSDTYNELYDLYLIFLTEDFSKILESKGGIGEIRTKEIIDVCYRYFKEHDLIRDTDGLYNGSFLKDTILNLEKLSTENKSSIVSPYIPPDYLEIFLELNYRSVEDLISDCQNGELKKRCESEYSKAVLGDVYNIVSEFTEAFIKKPVNYIRIRLLDYEDLPECIAMSLKAEVRKHRKSKNRIDDSIKNDFDLPEFVDELDVSDSELMIIDLDMPTWVKLLLGQAGIVDVNNLLVKQLSFDMLWRRYNIGLVAIKKLYYALDERGVRLKDCPKEDYPEIKDFLEKKRYEVLSSMLDEEIWPYRVAYYSVKLREYGALRSCGYISDDDNYSVGDYVVVPTRDNRNSVIGQIMDVEYLLPNEFPDLLDDIAHIVREADAQEYLAQIKAERDKWTVGFVTRGQLYNDLWGSSLFALAKKYGISIAQLIATLEKAHIPIPPNGYSLMSDRRKLSKRIPLQGSADEIVRLMKRACAT